MVKNMKEDEELEMLLGEIPHATSLSHHHYYHNHLHHHIVLPTVYDDNNNNDDYGSCGYSQHTCHSSSRNQNGFDETIINELGRMHIQNHQFSSTFGDSDYVSRIMNSDSEINPASFNFQQNCWNWKSKNFYKNALDYRYKRHNPAQTGMNSMDAMMHNIPYACHVAAGDSSNIRTPYCGLGPSVATCEDSLIIQGEDVSRVRKKFVKPCGNGQTDVQRYVFAMAKDQHGCRLLQKIFDKGNPQHVKIVFNEIIGHLIELMIDPFGNYLIQKLLEVCNEEQRMRILAVVTRETRKLVQVSLNTHGTRVVQKLIETLKTREQVKLVISAIEPGFLALIKDLNGNHVIQRCLQCLGNEDNKFIFEAAMKFCVEIATHQHGCCVLQRCINHSTGEHRERLVLEISRNGLLLAQDAFGNYVVQYILELQIPSAVNMLTCQFKGNYVQLATQKFSSHVVEKCLAVLDSQTRSTIIRELISAAHFEQLIQDPHANYVVQTALRVAEGPLHNSLVNAIESHKAVSRNSPYAKRIFSHKLLRM
ncbi:putative pumilio homolog 8, chloroplastic [Bidens hawaiensis]|uniref:putative pumilio homolog 8, chloroplastic n=1 Tax=Bidens hawaiensis TaxID=980011 RepID=UPI00404B709F